MYKLLYKQVQFHISPLNTLLIPKEPEEQQAVFEVIEGGQEASQSPIPEDKEDEGMEVMEAATTAAISEVINFSFPESEMFCLAS